MRQNLKIPPALEDERRAEGSGAPVPQNERTAQPFTKDSMSTLMRTRSGRTSILKAELPEISLKDVLIYQSERFASARPDHQAGFGYGRNVLSFVRNVRSISLDMAIDVA